MAAIPDRLQEMGFGPRNCQVLPTVHITCKYKNCRQIFEFEGDEQEFYAARGLSQPRKCQDCRWYGPPIPEDQDDESVSTKDTENTQTSESTESVDSDGSKWSQYSTRSSRRPTKKYLRKLDREWNKRRWAVWVDGEDEDVNHSPWSEPKGTKNRSMPSNSFNVLKELEE